MLSEIGFIPKGIQKMEEAEGEGEETDGDSDLETECEQQADIHEVEKNVQNSEEC